MKKIILAFGLILVMSMMATATTVTRDIPSATAGTNEDMTISLDVAITGGDTYYVIDEQLPSGIDVKSATGGDYTTKPGHISWIILQDATDITYTYTINTGSSPSTISFTGTYGSESKDETSILGDSSIAVGGGGAPPSSTPSSGGSDNKVILLVLLGVGGVILFNKFSK